MIKYIIVCRYSKALFNSDSDSPEKLQKRLGEFDCILATLEKDPKIVKFLNSPQISLGAKKTILKKCVNELKDPEFEQFILFLLEQRRFIFISEIAKQYRILVDQKLGIWEASLTTSVPIDSDLKERLIKKLEALYHKKIELTEKIDPKIIGGAFLLVGNQMIDWRVKTRLRKLKEALLT